MLHTHLRTHLIITLRCTLFYGTPNCTPYCFPHFIALLDQCIDKPNHTEKLSVCVLLIHTSQLLRKTCTHEHLFQIPLLTKACFIKAQYNKPGCQKCWSHYPLCFIIIHFCELEKYPQTMQIYLVNVLLH